MFIIPFFGYTQQSKGDHNRPLNVPIGNITKSNYIIIDNIPIYMWHRGCGPTALGMIIGYYDLHGFYDLYDDSTLLQTNNINTLIASDEHYNDYSLPEDYYPNLLQDMSETGVPHQNNSIADFMKTSMSICGNYWGWSWASDIGAAFEDYISFRNPNYITNTEYEYYSNNSWDEYKTEIDNNRPVIILVDTDGDGSTDHFVVGVGYDNSTQEFGCYDTWDNNLHWYSWRQIGSGINYGIYGFNKFNIDNISTEVEDELTHEKLYKIIDISGREINEKKNTPLLYLYDNGTIEKKIIIE